MDFSESNQTIRSNHFQIIKFLVPDQNKSKPFNKYSVVVSFTSAMHYPKELLLLNSSACFCRCKHEFLQSFLSFSYRMSLGPQQRQSESLCCRKVPKFEALKAHIRCLKVGDINTLHSVYIIK